MFVRPSSVLLIAALACCWPIAPASADTINSSSDHSLAGAQVVNFTGELVGSYSSRAFGNLTIIGVGGNFRISSNFAGQFNSTGLHVDNNEGGTTRLDLVFADPVSAFGFNFGASDFASTLTAYSDADRTAHYEDSIIPRTFMSNAGDFFGIKTSDGSALIRSASLTMAAGDYILLDNITLNQQDAVPVPLPAAAWSGIALFGVVGGRRLLRCRKIALPVGA